MVEEGRQGPSRNRNHRVLVVDHYDSYTWNLVHLVAAVTGDLPDVVEHDTVGLLERLPSYSHVVLSPGPGHPADPADFALGPAVFDLGLPVLGVCLGMQALVTAYGGTVERDRAGPRRGRARSSTTVSVCCAGSPRPSTPCATTRSPRSRCPTSSR